MSIKYVQALFRFIGLAIHVGAMWLLSYQVNVEEKRSNLFVGSLISSLLFSA